MSASEADATMYTDGAGCTTHAAGERGTTTGFLWENGHKVGAFVQLAERDALMFIKLHTAKVANCTCSARRLAESGHTRQCGVVEDGTLAIDGKTVRDRKTHQMVAGFREIDREEFDRLQGMPAMRESLGWREPSTPRVPEPDIQHVFARKQLGDVTLCGIPSTPAPHTDKPTCAKCFDRLLTVQDAGFVALSEGALDVAHAVALEREKCAALLDSKSDEQSALGWALKTVDENEQANACFGEANQLHLAAFAIRRGNHWKDGA